ncbi:MAG: hypothetical protein KF883_11510 [Thermomicrobiales bacterium]|nr:hypothetical protein [Thermomicrobiales bacterium]
MDSSRFDDLVRSLASGASRRRLLKGIIGIGAVVTASEALESDAREQRTRPTIPPPPPPPATTTPAPTTSPPNPCPGMARCSIDGCCDGQCTAQGRCCAAGRTVCGYECCASADQCCGRECCPDGALCVGEERCCWIDQ